MQYLILLSAVLSLAAAVIAQDVDNARDDFGETGLLDGDDVDGFGSIPAADRDAVEELALL